MLQITQMGYASNGVYSKELICIIYMLYVKHYHLLMILKPNLEGDVGVNFSLKIIF